jgi:uncharacterized membrane protein
MILATHPFSVPLAFLAFSIPASVFWPYFSGAVALAFGFAGINGSELSHLDHRRRFNGLTLFGPPFFAVAMAIFGADHMVAARFVAMGVPEWMPWRLFWAYFVGFALFAAALSLTTRIKWQLASGLLGSMIFMFVLMIHLPNLIKNPHDPVRLTILLRDTCLSAGALAFAASQIDQSGRSSTAWNWTAVGPQVIMATRFMVAIPIAVFGIDHFLHPTFAPGFPQENAVTFVAMPSWIPAHALWGYVNGGIFIACAFGLAIKRYVIFAAHTLGATVLISIVLVYIPLTIANYSDVSVGLNYLAIHFALAGAAFMLASAVSAQARDSVSAQEFIRVTQVA